MREVDKMLMELRNCILAVSDDGVPDTEAVLSDPEPKCVGGAINVQHVQTIKKQNYWVKPYGNG